ncbi:MAG: hypothetical protein ABSG31_01505 [Tepidisphaeraceae bacterium]
MPVMVDHEPMRAEELGLRTVGQVLSHLQRANRLVVHVLIDGQEPDMQRLGDVRKSAVKDHTVYIETTDPRQMALQVLSEVESQLAEAERLKSEAAGMLRKNQNVRAMERLSGCFTTWQNAQQSLLGTAQLLKIDLNTIDVDGRPLTELVANFTKQLKEIKSSLENRDFVTLTDLLIYDTADTTRQWRAAITAMRGHVEKR